MVIVWFLQVILGDFAFDLLAEFIGVAFTVFIIDTLLVKSKTSRWKVVQDNVDYLIARNINRLRDGIATRIFGFDPELKDKFNTDQNEDFIREQRSEVFKDLLVLSDNEFTTKIKQKELFSESSYEYFNEKAEDFWDIINMKYSEYLEPELVSLIIDLHTNLKDTCAHIRQYKKTERLKDSGTHYQSVSIRGITHCLKEVIHITNVLKEMGYSTTAKLANKN